jgi:hypothetical protein
MKRRGSKLFILSICISTLFVIGVFYMGEVLQLQYGEPAQAITELSTTTVSLPEGPEVLHLPTPESVKAIYMTSWAAGTPSFRTRLTKLLDETEANAVVIDIKDYSGKLAFPILKEDVARYEAVEKRIPDIIELNNDLHERGVYIIGRVSVFQDTHMTKMRPEIAVLNAVTGSVWKDQKGLSWVDPASREVWDYIVAIANESYKLGFDEINFDYVRFPSDGDVKNLQYPIFINATTTSRRETIQKFFSYATGEIRKEKEYPKLSADLFGMTTTATGDMGIGQVLEDALPYFDYVAPMVYPSHYPGGFNGWKNPASVPYETISYVMESAKDRAIAASSSPLKLRPWLQDFDLGAEYTADMVRAQIEATYDVGLTSWMLWDPSNKYTAGALLVD